MTNHQHPVDAALRKLVGNPQPSPQDRRVVEARLSRAIEAESASLRGGWSRRVRWVAAFTMMLLVAIYIVPKPTQVEAAAEEIAVAAEAVDSVTLPDNSYLYTRAEVTNLILASAEAFGEVSFDQVQVVYLLSAVRETWVGADETIRIRTTNQPPVFFAPEAEALYYEAGLDQADAIGERVTESFPAPQAPEIWPTEIHALDEAVRAEMANRDLPETVEYLDVAVDILRENLIEPRLRANTVRLIGQLPGLELAEPGSQQTTFAIEYEDDGIETQYTFTLDEQGYLSSERTSIKEAKPSLGVPANTTTAAARYLDREITTGIDP